VDVASVCAAFSNDYGNFSCLDVTTKGEEEQCSVLEEFYNALNGDNWLDNSNWLGADVSICEWF
jgi:hypothetical protein